jgi:hypothetical protein
MISGEFRSIKLTKIGRPAKLALGPPGFVIPTLTNYRQASSLMERRKRTVPLAGVGQLASL